jgi:metallo-beta-lactamase class B
MRLRLLLLTLALVLVTPLRAELDPSWTTPITPFKIADNLYYVGSRDLAAYLVTTSAGNILINANLDSSPPQIRASVEKLGFHWADTKILLNGQAHYDHLGGAAQIVRETHAQDIVMDGDVKVAESGGHADFMATSKLMAFYPSVKVDRILHDGDSVTLGGLTLTAHKTPGHTRGCTTWTFRAHVPGDPADKLRDVVIVGGVSFWSDYRLADLPGRPSSYPGIAQDYEYAFTVLRLLPGDIFLGAHGAYFNLAAKLARYPTEGPKVFIDPVGYAEFIADNQSAFEKELAKQKAEVH